MPDPADRYHRQTILPQIGEAGRRALAAARVSVVGCGALGAPAAELLARAGAGMLTLIDRDTVEPTNLQRQTLYDESDARARLPKAEAARRRLARINSEITLRAAIADVNHRTVEAHLRGSSVVLDAADNFETRYLVNDACVKLGLPLVYAGAVGMSGMVMTIVPRVTPCLRCVFESPPAPGAAPTCDTAGVFGPLTAMLGAMQAAEAIRLITGAPPEPRLRSVDAWSGAVRAIDPGAPRADCPCCALGRYEWLDGGRAAGAAALCGRDSVQILPAPGASGDRERLDLAALASRLAPHGAFEVTPFLLRGSLRDERGDRGTPVELTVFTDARAIIGGVSAIDRARAIYARYVGA